MILISMKKRKSQSSIRTIELGATDGFRYLKFKPPITDEQFAGIPYPQTNPNFTLEDSKNGCEPVSISGSKTKVSQIGFYSEVFYGSNDVFKNYAVQVAKHLGSTTVIPQIEYL